MRVEHDGAYAMVASQGGAPDHPAWYFNLKAIPRLDGPGRCRPFRRHGSGTGGRGARGLVEAGGGRVPHYAVYQTRTDRLIPVLLAERRT